MTAVQETMLHIGSLSRTPCASANIPNFIYISMRILPMIIAASRKLASILKTWISWPFPTVPILLQALRAHMRAETPGEMPWNFSCSKHCNAFSGWPYCMFCPDISVVWEIRLGAGSISTSASASWNRPRLACIPTTVLTREASFSTHSLNISACKSCPRSVLRPAQASKPQTRVAMSLLIPPFCILQTRAWTLSPCSTYLAINYIPRKQRFNPKHVVNI